MSIFTYADLNRPRLRSAVQALMDSNEPLRFAAAQKVAELYRSIVIELETARQAYEELGAAFAKKDEQGNIIRNDQGSFAIDDTKEAEFTAAFKRFTETPFKVRWGKIQARDLLGVKLRPLELFALEPFVEGLEELHSLEPFLGEAPAEQPTLSEVLETPAVMTEDTPPIGTASAVGDANEKHELKVVQTTEELLPVVNP